MMDAIDAIGNIFLGPTLEVMGGYAPFQDGSFKVLAWVAARNDSRGYVHQQQGP
jgi:hypothetical protein